MFVVKFTGKLYVSCVNPPFAPDFKKKFLLPRWAISFIQVTWEPERLGVIDELSGTDDFFLRGSVANDGTFSSLFF